jgi:hypothetical protein
VRSWPDHKSPWGKQLKFEPREFDSMMDELRFDAEQEHHRPGSGIDVELVMLKALKLEADYVDLPSGVMGRSLFAPDGKVTVEISRELSDAAESDSLSRRRLRTTLAHECGHIACHRSLFLRDVESLPLFVPSGPELKCQPSILCRQDSIGTRKYSGEWWEYQANQCMASLLLPKRLFGVSVRNLVKDSNCESFENLILGGGADEALRALSDEFDVSLTATLIRLETLGFVPRSCQAAFSMVGC